MACWYVADGYLGGCLLSLPGGDGGDYQERRGVVWVNGWQARGQLERFVSCLLHSCNPEVSYLIERGRLEIGVLALSTSSLLDQVFLALSSSSLLDCTSRDQMR